MVGYLKDHLFAGIEIPIQKIISKDKNLFFIVKTVIYNLFYIGFIIL